MTLCGSCCLCKPLPLAGASKGTREPWQELTAWRCLLMQYNGSMSKRRPVPRIHTGTSII